MITVRGSRLLSSCDAVVYDNLVPDELVVSLDHRQETHYVGKQPGAHSTSQGEINELLSKLAREGKTVARLKGSDPLVFGRGGEEARYLREQGIPFQIVPGVTSGIAAPAYAGIPCTDRHKASFVLFITGHKAAEKTESSVDFSWVAKARGGTLVIYMGVAEIPRIVDKLTKAGMAVATPAAAIERGTIASQRTVTCNLGELPKAVRQHGIKAPAIFVVGEVVQLRSWVRWFENRPLMGLRVMVTRPGDQAADMYESLRALGAEVLPYPTIATREVIDKRAWQEWIDLASEPRWLVFTSENGVRYFMCQFLGTFGDVRRLAPCEIAVVGPGTARALAGYHLTPDFVPSRATTKALARELVADRKMHGRKVVRVRGNRSDLQVETSVAEGGAEVTSMQVYETYYADWAPHRKERLLKSPPDVVTFTSGSTVEGLSHSLTPEEFARLTAGALLVSIGPSTSAVMRSRGLQSDVQATDHTVPGLISALVKHVEENPRRRQA